MSRVIVRDDLLLRSCCTKSISGSRLAVRRVRSYVAAELASINAAHYCARKTTRDASELIGSDLRPPNKMNFEHLL